MYLRWQREDKDTEFWWGNLLERGHVVDQRGYEKITLRWLLEKYVGWMGSGWNWLSIMVVVMVLTLRIPLPFYINLHVTGSLPFLCEFNISTEVPQQFIHCEHNVFQTYH
jgi:hypothetical protein